MLVTFYCETCNSKLRINADAMGSELMCPECEAVLKVPHMQLGPGFVIGGFLIKHKLGEGGMGEVYLATQLSLERDVALKILPKRFTRENSFVVRFLKEVHYQAKLDHPNIVTAYDAGEDNEVYFMAMAYVAGETLEEWLNREGTLPEKDALQVIRQVASALEYASGEKGIIHRDIKPANIMLTPSLHAKVLDMGLSKNTFEKNSSTLADTLMGTPNYMSPEQIDHPQDLDTRSDMFSLGMTFYHMLTGIVPFEESGYLKTLQRHAKEKLEDPRELVPGISKGCVHLLANMLARDPEDRYADWEGLSEDLKRVIAHKEPHKVPTGESTMAIQSPPPPPLEKTPPVSPFSNSPVSPSPGQRSKKGVILSIASGLVLGLIGIVFLANQQKAAPGGPVPASVPGTAILQVPTPLPLPSPPLEDLSSLQKELTAIILEYERTRTGHDQVIHSLLDVAARGKDSPVSEAAAQHIVRIRRDRDEALDAEREHLRQQTLTILYEQGPEPARNYLNTYSGPFEGEVRAQKEKLRRRITIWEEQEHSQREEERVAAQQAFDELLAELAVLIVNREWPAAGSLVADAAADPTLFPLSTEVAALQKELLELQRVPTRILESYSKQLNQNVVLKLQEKDLAVIILDVKSDGLLVGRTVYSEDGNEMGSAELFLPFSVLSSEEIFDQVQLLEGKAAFVYKGLLAHKTGELLASRRFLEEAGSPLALAIQDRLFQLPTLDRTRLDAWELEQGSPLNTPRFAPLPTLEFP